VDWIHLAQDRNQWRAGSIKWWELLEWFSSCWFLKKCSAAWNKSVFVEFHFLTAVAMKSIVFWEITSCSPLKVNRCFGGALLAICFHADILLGFFFLPRKWLYVPPKRRLNFNELYGVISQQLVLFKSVLLLRRYIVKSCTIFQNLTFISYPLYEI
jgi:hypothetical protein